MAGEAFSFVFVLKLNKPRNYHSKIGKTRFVFELVVFCCFENKNCHRTLYLRTLINQQKFRIVRELDVWKSGLKIQNSNQWARNWLSDTVARGQFFRRYIDAHSSIRNYLFINPSLFIMFWIFDQNLNWSQATGLTKKKKTNTFVFTRMMQCTR